MKLQVHNLKRDQQGEEVAQLHQALILLKFTIPPIELDNKLFDKGTFDAVRTFQKQHGLEISGVVDAKTVDLINEALNAIDPPVDPPIKPTAVQRRIVSGTVKREDGLPLQGVIVHALFEGKVRLGEDTTDAAGQYTIHYDPVADLKEMALSIAVVGTDGKTLVASEPKVAGVVLLNMDVQVPLTPVPDATRRIEGRMMLEHGLPATGVKLRLYQRAFGDAPPTLLNETATFEGGQYAFEYAPGTQALSLEVRALDSTGKEVVLTKPLNNLVREANAEVNLIAPSTLQPLAPEYRRLASALIPHVGSMDKLAGAKETEEHQDLTVLNRATGWDARLIALATNSERLISDASVGLSAEVTYGLLRAGLPSDKLLLAQVGADTAEQALKRTRDVGIIGLTDAEIATAKDQFTKFAVATQLNLPTPGSASSYGRFLNNSGLDAAAQQKFAPVFLEHTGDAAQLWSKAKAAGLEDAQINALKVQGKFAFLANNSDTMTAHLGSLGLQDPLELVDRDLHEADGWRTEVLKAAGVPQERWANLNEADQKAVGAVIPSAFTNDTLEVRLADYSDDMARKVRVGYPTHVLGRLLETDATDRFVLGAEAQKTAKLLKGAASAGFKLGQTPVATFFRDNPVTVTGLTEADLQVARDQLVTLHCVYQMTPNNEAMPVLMAMGMTSAYNVMAYAEAEFTLAFDNKYIGIYAKPAPAHLAEKIFRKANQISSVTYNLFAIAKKMESDAPVASMSASAEVRDSVRDELLKHYPTMESLFGSMDFCDCEHCRSVLSPAAYLVDLLQFIDTEESVWNNFLAHWRTTHGGQEYPHKDTAGNALKPFDALLERRPDIQNIQLTCENTQTAMPYIDIVNEILEYFVANNKLDANAAHDTGTASSAELLAEPQNVIREAYDTLREAKYPLNLPFDLWLETVRQFCAQAETPLEQVLEVFRPGDDLFAPGQAYDRSSIFFESLGISAAELLIFTNPDPLATWFRLYGFNNEAEALTEAVDAESRQRIDLKSAKALSRRLGVSYKEITAIVQTGFVNPALEPLVMLEKLGVSIQDVVFYNQHKALFEANKDLIGVDRLGLSPDNRKRFDAQLEPNPKTQRRGFDDINDVDAFRKRLDKLAAQFSISVSTLETELAAISLDQILVLADPDSGCNFDLTTLRYADQKVADPIAFLRINLFVRLWRKLGWSIEETDRALRLFVPKDTPFDQDNLNQAPLKTALIYLAHLQTLSKRINLGKQGRIKLLSFWADLPTLGNASLYAQVFLNRSVLKGDPVFDDPLGRYLSKPGVLLKDHLPAVQSAIGLNRDEIELILKEAPLPLETAPLSLANVSLLYRHRLLSKALKLTVREMIALAHLSGLDPFKAIEAAPLTVLEKDHPYTQTLAFVEVSKAIKGSGFGIEDLEYLLRHRFDQTGKYRPNPEALIAVFKTLGEAITAIHREHAMPTNPLDLTDEVLRQKLGLVLPADVVTRFLAMLNGSVEYTAKTPALITEKLDPSGFRNEASISNLLYNDTRKEQQLTFKGVLLATQKGQLEASLPDRSPDPHVASPTLITLLTDVQAQAKVFFDTHLLKRNAALQPLFGFLEATDFEVLFKPLSEIDETLQENAKTALRSANTKLEQDKRRRLGEAFLPFLQERLIRQLVVQTIAAQTAADPNLVEALLTDAKMMAALGPLLAALAATGTQGVDATFFISTDLTGAPQNTIPILGDVKMALRPDNDLANVPLPVANSARFTGFVEVPTPGAYRFLVAFEKQNAQAALFFDHLPTPLFWQETAPADGAILGEKTEQFLELKAGVRYGLRLELSNLNGGSGELLVQGESLAKGDLARLKLTPRSVLERAEQATMLLGKVLQVVLTLGLSQREVQYLLTHGADFDNLNLGQWPTTADDDTPAARLLASERFKQLRRLVDYARLKRDLAAGNDDLIAVFEANASSTPPPLQERIYPLLASLTRREVVAIRDCASTLATNPSFANEQPIASLWAALEITDRFGSSASSIRAWSSIVGGSLTAAQRFGLARDLKENMRARFGPEDWQGLAAPVFDRLRQRQRDALAAQIMHRLKLSRLEELYEHFLIDPGMEPVVQTSRIRLAIGAVQLFIQRSLLNLERHVHPSTINAKHWEWMKRYRVWEANRKIFLYPENWLEPEFRDDKTFLYSELEGALLQGDVSNDLVEDAFLAYLKKLDELARLDVIAMHLEDAIDPAQRTLHVIGRTFTQPHKYFYRRYAHQEWTPWEPITTEVEGDHLAPVIWRDRLYLFWVTFMEKPNMDGASSATPNNDPTKLGDLPIGRVGELRSIAVGNTVNKQVDVQLHWSEFLGGTWSTRESSGAANVMAIPVAASFDSKSVFIHVGSVSESDVTISLGGIVKASFHLAGRNSSPQITGYTSSPSNPYNVNTPAVTRFWGSGALNVTFRQRIRTEADNTTTASEPKNIFGQGDGFRLLPANNEIFVGGPDRSSVQASDPDLVARLIASGLPEITTLSKPFFYEDGGRTMFLEPTVTETTVEEWEEWIAPTPRPSIHLVVPDLKLKSYLPVPDYIVPTFGPEDFLPNPEVRYKPDRGEDWLTNSKTGLVLDGKVIGSTGISDVKFISSQELATLELPATASVANVHFSSGLPVNVVAMVSNQNLAAAGMSQVSGRLNLVGSTGFNAGLNENLASLKR